MVIRCAFGRSVGWLSLSVGCLLGCFVGSLIVGLVGSLIRWLREIGR